MSTLWVACWTSFTWTQVLVAGVAGLAVCQLNLFLTTAVLHRGLTHGAIAYSGWLKRSVAAWLFLTASVPPLTWSAAHRHHHANSDTPEDPHSPGRKGFWRVLLLTWYYVPSWARANWTVATERYLQALHRERLLHLLDRPATANTNFYLQLALSLALGPVAMAFWLARLAPYMLLSGYVNSVGHTLGDRPYDNLGTNARGALQTILSYMVGGETLGHNYHHRYPTSARFRHDCFDPGFWFATTILRGVPVRSPVGPGHTGSPPRSSDRRAGAGARRRVTTGASRSASAGGPDTRS